MNVTLAALGKKIGISVQQIQKYEIGTNRIQAARLQKIAAALDVPLTHFYDEQDTPSEVESLLNTDNVTALRIMRAYTKIRDQSVQRSLVVLIEAIAKGED